MSGDLRLNLRIAVNADGSAQVLGSTRDGINGISNASGNASRSLRSMDSAAAGVMCTLAPLIGIYELISFGDKIVKDTATVQDLDTRLHSLTAAAGDYSKTVAYINTVAEDQHKKLNDLSDGYARLRTLQNSGIITGQQTQGMFEGLNNAGSDLGASNDQLKQTFFGLAQGLASGILHAEELNQVTEPLPGLLQSLDKAAGLSAGGFRKLTVDGKVTSQMFAETLVKALHDFDGAAAATAKNVNAKSTDISNSWTQLVTSFEPSTSAIFTPLQDGIKEVLDSTRQFNEAAITVGETNVSASALAQGAWAVTTNAISDGWGILKAAGLGAAADTVSGWIVSGDQMQSNVKFVVNDMIGLFVGLGHSVGIIFGALAINVGNTLDNAIAKASAAAGDVARMGVGDFSFSSSKAVVDKPMVNGWTDAAAQLKIDLSTDYIGTFTEAVKGASLAYQGLSDEQKKAAAEAEQAKAKVLQLAGAHNAVGSAAGLSAEATKKAAAEAKKHADAIAKEIDSLNDQHLKLSLSERDYELSKLAALGMSDAVKAASIAIWDSNQVLEAQKKGIDAGVSAMDAERDRYDKLTMSAQQYLYTQLLLKGVSPGDAIEAVSLASVNDQIEAQRKAADEAMKTLEDYNKTLGQTREKTLDLNDVSSSIFDGALGGISAMAGAFDNMVVSVEKNSKALDENAKMQLLNEKTFDPQVKAANAKKYAAVEEELLNERVQDELKGARQMAGAAAKMFDEKSTAARAFHGIEVALSVASMALKLQEMAMSAKATVVKVIEGASTFFAQSGWAGFAGVAAMGAVMAGLGYGMMSNSGASSEPPKMSPDTGTVLGDSTAKSESIDKTYQLLKDIHAEEYATLRSIDRGIADLHSGITDVITRLFQAGGLKDFATMPTSKQSFGMVGNAVQMGAMLGSGGLAKFDPIGNAVLGFLFGGKQTSTVTGQGITTGATSIADIMAGGNLTAQQFATIETKTKGGIFSSDKVSYSQQLAEIDAGTQKALNSVFKSMGDTMLGLADNLGFGLSDRVKNYIIPALSVDLKGLNGEDAAKKLNGVISAALDTMSTSVFGDLLGQYQQLGEGLLETAVRIVSEIAVVKDALATSGLSITGDAIAISDSLAQAAGGIKEFQKQFSAYFDKFYTDAEKQSRTQSQLSAQLGDVSLSLSASREGYRQQVEAVDLSTAAGQQQYSMLLKLSATADTYYKGVEDAAAKAAETAAKAAETAAQLAKRHHALDISLLEANGHVVAALTAKRKDEIAALDESLRATQNAIYAAQDRASALTQANKDAAGAMAILQKSVAAEKTTLTNTYNASIKTTQTAIDGLNTSVQSLSTLAAKLKGIVDNTVIPGNEASDRSYAQSVLSSALILYKSGGGLGDQNALSNALDVVAKPSENLFATFSDYQKDFAVTAGTIAALSDAAASTTSKATSQLDVMKTQLQITKDGYDADIKALDTQIANAQAQIDAINGTTVAVMTVADAINNLGGSLAALSARKDPIGSMYQSLLGRTPDAAGSSFWNASMESGASLSTIASGFVGSPEYAANISGSADPIAALYQNLLGRAPDAAGAAFWQSSLNSGASIADIAKGFTDSPEYQSIKAVRGYASGGSHEGGWRVVGERGWELEHTGPSQIYSHSQSKSLIDNTELIAEIRVLNSTVDELKAEVTLLRVSSDRGNENTQRTADTLNGHQGMPFLVEIAS